MVEELKEQLESFNTLNYSLRPVLKTYASHVLIDWRPRKTEMLGG